MKVLLSVVFCLMPISTVAQDRLHLTVTKITREWKATADCDRCGRVTTIEASTDSSSFVLVCEAHIHPRDMEHNTMCADVRTRTYAVRLIGADEISFWPDNSPGEPRAYRLNFSIISEEMRP